MTSVARRDIEDREDRAELTLQGATMDERHARRRAELNKTQAVRIGGATRWRPRAASTAQPGTANPLLWPVKGGSS